MSSPFARHFGSNLFGTGLTANSLRLGRRKRIQGDRAVTAESDFERLQPPVGIDVESEAPADSGEGDAALAATHLLLAADRTGRGVQIGCKKR
jgi:hypothetical protein